MIRRPPQTTPYQPPGAIIEIQPTQALAVNDDREQIWGRTHEYDTTGKMWNILQKIFRILPIVDFLHSAFRIPHFTLTRNRGKHFPKVGGSYKFRVND